MPRSPSSALDHPDTLTTLNNLAFAYLETGKLPEAIALFERVRDAQIAKLGPDHPDTLITLNNLAAAYWSCKAARQIRAFVRGRAQAERGQARPPAPGYAVTVANLGSTTRTPAGSTRRSHCSKKPIERRRDSRTLRWVGDSIARCLCEGRRERQARRLAPGALGRGPQGRCPRTARNWPACSPSSV